MSFKKRTSKSQQRVCAAMRILFAAFLFFFFYLSQDASLTLAQHQLSQGQTSYHPLIGAIILTVLLVGLQRIVCKIFRFRETLYVLTFFPSALVSVLLTAFTPSLQLGALIASAVLTVVWIIVAIYETCRDEDFRRHQRTPSYLSHLFCFFLVMLYMGLCGNSYDIVNYEVHAARYINNGEYDKALKVGENALTTSRRLTALRAFAQSHNEEEGLADKLFAWPLPKGGSEILYLYETDTLDMLFKLDSLYSYLKIIPGRQDLTALEYFKQAARKNPQSAAKDYWLCALLLDKNLDEFAAELPNFYTVSDSTVLPIYYAEALILYNRVSQEPLLDYNDPNIVANYLDFRETGERITNLTERRNLLWRDYGHTYWWYYIYHE